jgi:hypothetical protein
VRVEQAYEKPVTTNPDKPVYKVIIWERMTGSSDIPEDDRAFMADEWALYDGDVVEVLEWARRKAGSFDYQVYVAGPYDEGDSTLLRLCGRSPVAISAPPGEYFTLAPDQD